MQKDPIFYDAVELQDLTKTKGGVNTQRQQNESILIDNYNIIKQTQPLNVFSFKMLLNHINSFLLQTKAIILIRNCISESLRQLYFVQSKRTHFYPYNYLNSLENDRDFQQKQNQMTIAQRKDLLLFKNINEQQPSLDGPILEEIKLRIDKFQVENNNQYTHIQKLRIISCQKDILPLLSSIIFQQRFCMRKINSKIQLKSITIKNSHFSGHALKEIIKMFKDTLQSIVIEDSYPINQNRNDCLVDLFIRSSVKPKRLPNIKYISISLMNQQSIQNNVLQQQITFNPNQQLQNISNELNNPDQFAVDNSHKNIQNLKNLPDQQNLNSNQQIAQQNQQQISTDQPNTALNQQNISPNQQNIQVNQQTNNSQNPPINPTQNKNNQQTASNLQTIQKNEANQQMITPNQQNASINQQNNMQNQQNILDHAQQNSKANTQTLGNQQKANKDQQNVANNQQNNFNNQQINQNNNQQINQNNNQQINQNNNQQINQNNNQQNLSQNQQRVTSNQQNNINNQNINSQNQQNVTINQQNMNQYQQNISGNQQQMAIIDQQKEFWNQIQQVRQQNGQFNLLQKNQQDENEEKVTYNQLVQKIIDDFKLHLVMSENYFKNGIDFESKFLYRQLTLLHDSHKIVIDQKCFNLREHFRYFKEYIQLNRDAVEVVLFVNINRVDLYLFKDILVLLRRVKNLKQLCFVRFQIENQILQLIKNFLYWRKNDLQELYFIQCSLNDLDLKFLFQKDNLQITDYALLNKIIMNENPLVTKDYMMPILYELEEWKAERIRNNIYKYPLKFNIFENNSQYSKHFKLRKRPEIITEGGVICKENENFLIKYFTDFFQNSLVLDQFPLDQALSQTIFLMFQLIRTSKSLCKLSLRNTNLLNLSIPIRFDNQEILSFIEEIDLSENSFVGQSKLITFFSHVNISHLKKLRLQKMDFDDFDFEDIPTILKISKNLKILDLSGTKGFKDHVLLNIIESIGNIEELYLRDCGLNEQTLSVLNQRLYQEANAAFEDHQKKLKYNHESLISYEDQNFLMEHLRIIDLSENKEMGSCLVDFLMYVNALSYESNITLHIENIDLSEQQVKSFLEQISEKRITSIEIFNISKNFLARISAELLVNFLITLVRENKKNLRKIIMKDTQLDIDQLILIDKVVLDKSRLGNIEVFDLSGIGQLSLQELCFRGIFKSLSLYSKTITTLVWDNIGISNLNGLDLSQIISQFYMLEKFDISNNMYLTEKNIKDIVLGLSTLKHLTEFKMQNMGFNDQQMTCLVDALMGRISTASSKYTIEEDFQESSTFQSLQVLDMSGNKFCDHNQWKRFFYVVLSSQYNRLTTLVLKNIHLDDLIAFNLATVINERYQQIRIQTIDISYNTHSLSDAIFVTLIDAFQKIKQLRKFYCRNVLLNSHKIQSLCALILSNQMELLDISENGPSSKLVFSDTVQYKQLSSDQFIPSQSLTNLFGCINGSFTYEHLQKILKQQELLDDPKRQFDIVADDENGQRCPSIKESNIVKLNLSNNQMLSYYDFKKIIKSINYIGSSNICHLTIQNCQLNNKLDLLNEFLSQRIYKLYYIDISHNQIQSKHSQKFLEIISQKFSDHLEYLDISYTNFTDDELFYLSHTLAESFLSLNYANFSGLQHISPKCLQGLLTGLTLASQFSLQTLVIKDLKISKIFFH